jgi:hypothetical protein
MRSGRLATIGIALALSAATCRYVWTYDDYKFPNGETCADAGECESGKCELGVCCAMGCGLCHTCADGQTCGPAAKGTPDPRCPPGHPCSGAGTCM